MTDINLAVYDDIDRIALDYEARHGEQPMCIVVGLDEWASMHELHARNPWKYPGGTVIDFNIRGIVIAPCGAPGITCVMSKSVASSVLMMRIKEAAKEVS
jgi:hypothetical protein